MQGASRQAYAAALERFEQQIADRSDGTDAGQVSEGLYAVAALLDREPSLRRALVDPASTPSSREQLVDTLLGEQLAALPLTVVRELAHATWSSPTDLRDAVERLAANATLRAAEDDGGLDDVEDELFRFARVVEREPALRAALTDPALPAERKSQLLRALLGSQARPATVALVEVAVTRSRGRSLEGALDELSAMAAARRSRLVAQVRVAIPLDEPQQTRLASALAEIYGRAVQLQVDVDPTVLGGAQVQVGEEVLDGTMTRRLDDARRQLTR